VGIAQQLVMPTTALLVIVCTFLGDWAVFSAGLVSALAVATGTTLTARMVAKERGASGSSGGNGSDGSDGDPASAPVA
jgi:hypothetical protein